MRTELLALLLGAALLVSVCGLPQDAETETQDSSSAKESENKDAEKGNTIDKVSNKTDAVPDKLPSAEEPAQSPRQTDEETPDTDKGSEKTENEGEEDDTAESLADYIIQKLFNTTDETKDTAPAQPNATVSSSQDASQDTDTSSSEDSTEGEEVEAQEADEQPSGQDDIEKPDDNKKEDGFSDDENWDESGGKQKSESTTSPSKPEGTTWPWEENCDKEVDLADYCSVDQDVLDYLGGTTVAGIRSPLFDMAIVQRLMDCPRGEWCLEDEMDQLKSLSDRFYSSPLCGESMWECIFRIMVIREKCPDQEFMFVVDAIDLVCDLFAETPKEPSEKICIARVLAALHVTYADFLADDMAYSPPEESIACAGHAFRMTRTYLCADGACSSYFDARLEMEKFPRWRWFVENVKTVTENCTPSNVCEPLPAPAPTSPYWEVQGDEEEEEGNEGVEGGEIATEHKGGMTPEDESLMLALSVASAVGLLFMVLGLFFWRRSRRRSLYYYRTVNDGYDKVPSDEAHLLPPTSSD